MKVLTTSKDKLTVTIQVESVDELWYLSQIITQGDIVTAATERKIKVDAKSEESATKRVKTTLGVQAEKIEYVGDAIKILGTIVESPDFISKGDYHSLYIDKTTRLTIHKEQWNALEKKRFEEAQSNLQQAILIVRFDREEAQFSLVQGRTVTPLVHLKGNVEKKQYETSNTTDFYSEIVAQIEEYHSRYVPHHIIIGAQPFWQQEIKKRMTHLGFSKKLIFAESDYLKHKRAIDILYKPEVQKRLESVVLQQEQTHVDMLFKRIAKDNLAVYGKEDVEQAAYAGAIDRVLVTDGFIKRCQEEGTFQPINEILQQVELQNGDIDIIQSDYDHGKHIDGLGGIAALLRYPIA